MPDTVPAMLEPGEFVIRKDAAEKIGMDKLNMLNNADRLESGHSAIDELIALSTLSGSQQMMSGGDVKKMPQSGYMQDGGSVDDPLEIDARQRMGIQQAMGNIGMMDNTSDKGILSGLSKMQRDIELLKMMESRYPNPKSMREYRSMKEDSGDIMNMDEMIEALSRAAGATQNKFKVEGYDNGGQVYQYGTGSTEVPNIADIYEAAGIMPDSPEQLEAFQSKFLYDPSREETTVADYMSNVSGIRSSASGALESARAKSESIGGGFAGFGERGRIVSEAGEAVGEKAGRALEGAQRGLFEDIRQQREDYISAGVAGLDRLGEAGTTGYNEERPEGYVPTYLPGVMEEFNPPGFPEEGTPQQGEFFEGDDGKSYYWNGSMWMKQN